MLESRVGKFKELLMDDFIGGQDISRTGAVWWTKRQVNAHNEDAHQASDILKMNISL